MTQDERSRGNVATTRLFLRGIVAVLALWCDGVPATARGQDAPARGVLFENVRIFNGKDDALSPPSNVLVMGDTIQSISTSAIPSPDGGTVERFDGKGRTLMPGLIDNHWHTML